ncbi:aldo/keto reductase [Candidatus Bathyarchaeota archaeon]|nr:MAG: aldo/keto reductase [Candidatus Bathyarchaeota archaeon]
MEYKRIGKSDLRVSSLGIGAAFRSGITESSPKIIRKALDLGINLIDTAEIYHKGMSEKVVGEAIRDRRDEVVVKTKVARDHLKYDDVLKAADGSLKRLGVNMIDLYLVHHPNPNVPVEETMKAMEKLVDEGKVRYIGVSNFDDSLIKKAQEALSRHEIVANEVKYNLIEREIEENLLPYCKKEGISIIAYSPLARGLLTGRFGEDFEIPKGHWRKRDPLFQEPNFSKALELVKVLRKIAGIHDKTVGQVALNWLASKPEVIPIFGVSSISQVEENCGAVGWKLNDEDLQMIETACKKLSL